MTPKARGSRQTSPHNWRFRTLSADLGMPGLVHGGRTTDFASPSGTQATTGGFRDGGAMAERRWISEPRTARRAEVYVCARWFCDNGATE